jgi:serine/threonine-protein kinase
MAARFDDGKMRCESCSTDFDFRKAQPLAVCTCPHCGIANFAPLKIASFWLFHPLGGGGRGSVYRAVDTGSDTLCAVKIVQRDCRDDPGSIIDIRREAEALRKIGAHPNIVRFVDGGDVDGEPYCAIEFVEGERLSDQVGRLGHLPEAEVRSMVLDMIAAERQIYNSGFLYRDLKPQNIICRKNGSYVLIDFGSCIPTEQARSVAPDCPVEGYAYYMPPERVRRQGEDLCSEIYSLGMVMFHALTGRTFFNSTQTAKDLALKHVSALRLKVSADTVRECSAPMAELIGWMIMLDPRDRPQTFGEVEKKLNLPWPR